MERTKGFDLLVDAFERAALPDLAEDEFYHTDLIGLEVRGNVSGEKIGKVEALYNFGANDIIEIKLDATGKLEMLPFNKQYVPDVSVKDGFVVVEETSFATQARDEDEG